MEYRFIHYSQKDPDEKEKRILDAAIALHAKERNEAFLQEVAAFIAEHLQVQYVVIGLLTPDGKHVRTLAYTKGNEVLKNETYPLSGTPCDNVFIQRFCYYPQNVTSAFPEDNELQKLQIESYLGTILLSADGEPLGLIGLMDVKPLLKASFAEHLLLVLSPAIEEELAKQKNDN